MSNNEALDALNKRGWTSMKTQTSSALGQKVSKVLSKISGDLQGEELSRVLWLSIILFFIVGGYWLLRSLKDPVMSSINGVEYIPQAKIASLFVVFGLVIVYNKLLDMYKKHELFYYMGIAYAVAFFIMGLMLMHPTIGLKNTEASPDRYLGWISYVTIESFGSMVVQCYWALVNNSVDSKFGKKNFGKVIAGAQIGSILGPTLATQAYYFGIPMLYLISSVVMFGMVFAMYMYVTKFGTNEEEVVPGADKKEKKSAGILEGFHLFYEHNYVKGLFVVSSFFMIQVTVVDFLMKVLAKEKYSSEYPDDPEIATQHFASFMGYFGQATNSISLLFSFFGTGLILEKFGLTLTLISFPCLLLICSIIVWTSPSIWIVFTVMMIMKALSYALNNPTKEILYQVTSTSIKFKCKSWIDTFGQRSAKASGSIITGLFASNLVDLVNYGSLTGVITCLFLIYVSNYMGKEYEELESKGIKVGEEELPSYTYEMTSNDQPDSMEEDDLLENREEGQDHSETPTN